VIAQELTAFRSELPDGFTSVIARHGRVLIEDWIDGEALPDVPRPHHLAAAGALLAELHAKPRLGDRKLHGVCSTAHQHQLAQNRLRIVVAAGALRAEEAARLERALELWDPLRATVGLVHLDFCGENMVIDREGRLRVVDNERVRVDAPGYDLARTWYRWALPAREWDAFCLAYTARLPFPSSLDSLRFWKIAAVILSAELRLHAYPEKAGVPIDCLRALAAEETL
jgi:Ser/Thr protein kinase RdoA (MazF antagonist)